MPNRKSDRPGLSVAFQIVLAYALAGAGWILLSDRVLEMLTRTPEAYARWQNIKGWSYVGVTALLLYAVLQAFVASQERAEAALRESEERYRTFFRTSRDSVFITTTGGRWVDMNQAAVELFGYRDEEALRAIPIPHLYADPGDREDHTRAIADQGFTKDYPVDLRRKDGTVIHTLITSVARTDDAGNMIGFQGTIRDVTEHRRAQARIRRLNAVLRAIRGVNQLLVRAQDRGRLLQRTCELLIETRSYDSAWVALLDESQELAHVVGAGLGDRFAEMVEHLEQGELPLCARQALAQPGVVVFDDTRSSCPDCPLVEEQRDTSAMTVRLEHQGVFHGLLTVYLPADFSRTAEEQLLFYEVAGDIAFGLSKIELEEELRRSEARYRTLFNSASDAILIHDPQGRFLQVNDVACERLGYTREELLQMATEDIDAPEFAHLVPDRIARLRAQGHLYFETVHLRRDGFRIPMELSSRVIDYGGGKAVLTVARDVSQRKGLERQLRRQERLAAMGRLAGGVAHDFNNLLASIILNVQLILRSEPVSARVEKGLQSVLEDSDRAADLVEQILDFSRSAMMEPEPLDLGRLIEEAATLLRRTIQENIRLILELPSQPYAVEADRTRIHQVLVNLATNARDAMSDGGDLRIGLTRIDVEAGETPPVVEMPPGKWVSLRVSDTGTGMTDEVMANLFEPFFTTKEEGQGTGLGLAQVYGIVRQHGGFIDVETAVGEGTAFTIYFPLTDEVPVEPERQTEGSPPQGHGERILVVEDASRLRQAIKMGLEALNYRVVTAATAREALEAYGREAVDLVVTDIVMPDRSGKDLLLDLRADRPDLKVIAMTGYAVDEDVPSELAGFDGLIHKPFSIEDLGTAIRDALGAP
jgi:PAS domain S-box-containing protein